MRASLAKLAALPPDTRVFCAHEYTASNAKVRGRGEWGMGSLGRTRATPRAAHHANPLFFQWALAVDPTNAALAARAEAITVARAAGEATVPSLLADELATNPFLRSDAPAVRAGVGAPSGASPDAAFAAVRAHKDKF